MNGNGMSVNGGLPYTNEGYDAQKNQQTLGYPANGIEGVGSAEFKYPHLQLRDVSCDVRSEGGGWETLLNSISLEAKGGEILAILSTKCKQNLQLNLKFKFHNLRYHEIIDTFFTNLREYQL